MKFRCRKAILGASLLLWASGCVLTEDFGQGVEEIAAPSPDTGLDAAADVSDDIGLDTRPDSEVDVGEPDVAPSCTVTLPDGQASLNRTVGEELGLTPSIDGAEGHNCEWSLGLDARPDGDWLRVLATDPQDGGRPLRAIAPGEVTVNLRASCGGADCAAAQSTVTVSEPEVFGETSPSLWLEAREGIRTTGDVESLVDTWRDRRGQRRADEGLYFTFRERRGPLNAALNERPQLISPANAPSAMVEFGGKTELQVPTERRDKNRFREITILAVVEAQEALRTQPILSQCGAGERPTRFYIENRNSSAQSAQLVSDEILETNAYGTTEARQVLGYAISYEEASNERRLRAYQRLLDGSGTRTTASASTPSVGDFFYINYLGSFGACNNDVEHLLGRIGEVLVFDSALGPQRIQAVSQYLADKWR